MLQKSRPFKDQHVLHNSKYQNQLLIRPQRDPGISRDPGIGLKSRSSFLNISLNKWNGWVESEVYTKSLKTRPSKMGIYHRDSSGTTCLPDHMERFEQREKKITQNKYWTIKRGRMDKRFFFLPLALAPSALRLYLYKMYFCQCFNNLWPFWNLELSWIFQIILDHSELFQTISWPF